MKIDRIQEEAAKQGYELVRAEESVSADDFLGLLIFVRMTKRKIRDEDKDHIYRAAEILRTGLERVSAETDPEAGAIRQKYRNEIAGIYERAGAGAIFVEEIPNQYCDRPCCLNRPWFKVTSKIGHVVIGWRKSVISIDWKDSIVKKRGDEFNAPSTSWETGLHAWGVDDAVNYIRQLHQEEVRK